MGAAETIDRTPLDPSRFTRPVRDRPSRSRRIFLAACRLFFLRYVLRHACEGEWRSSPPCETGLRGSSEDGFRPSGPCLSRLDGSFFWAGGVILACKHARPPFFAEGRMCCRQRSPLAVIRCGLCVKTCPFFGEGRRDVVQWPRLREFRRFCTEGNAPSRTGRWHC